MGNSRSSSLMGLVLGGILVFLGLKFIIPAAGILGYLITIAAMVMVLLSAYGLLGYASVEAPGRSGGDQYSDDN